jgi:tRNA-specific 2-thiouridylase
LVPGSVEILSNDEFQVKLQAPARDITPGQAAVLYNDDEVIGSGIIQTVDIEGE